jgi:hypothetical protein
MKRIVKIVLMIGLIQFLVTSVVLGIIFLFAQLTFKWLF